MSNTTQPPSHNYFLNDTIPHCPSINRTPHPLEDIGYPTTAIIFVVIAVTSLVCAIIIAFKYNSVKVFNRKIRTQNISNTMWIVYYLTIGLRASSGAVLYGLTHPEDDVILHGVFFYLSLICSAINAFALCLSLNHQRRYRSSAPPNPTPQGSSGGVKEGDPLLGKSDLWKRTTNPTEILFFVLFVANLALLYVAIKMQHTSNETLFVLLYVGSYIAERLPIIVLVLVIVMHRNGNEGPTRQSKVYLFFAALLHLSSDLPIFFWAQVLPGGCVVNALSYIDILVIVNFFALVLFFLFLRSEYLRNMEECIWTTVSQIQDTFDFRRF